MMYIILKKCTIEIDYAATCVRGAAVPLAAGVKSGVYTYPPLPVIGRMQMQYVLVFRGLMDRIRL